MQFHVKTNAKHKFDETLWPGGEHPLKVLPQAIEPEVDNFLYENAKFWYKMAGHHFEEILRVRGEAGRMEDQGRFNILF